MKPTTFAFDRSWDFALPRAELWSRVSDTPSFSDWWPWLRAFDPVPIEVGAATTCTIGPPLPYVLTIDLEVTGVVHDESVDLRPVATSAARLDSSWRTPATVPVRGSSGCSRSGARRCAWPPSSVDPFCSGDTTGSWPTASSNSATQSQPSGEGDDRETNPAGCTASRHREPSAAQCPLSASNASHTSTKRV